MASVRRPNLPSERTLAFAVTIVKSKPPELRIEEYIQLLRQHVAKGRRENALSTTYRHLDRSAFWHGESERVNRELRTAELENVELRIEVDKLKTKLENAKIAQPKKRKRVDEDVIPVPRSPKRPKQDPPSLKRDGSTEKLDGCFNLTNVGEVGNILMRGLFKIQNLLENHRNDIDINAIANAVIRVAGALPQVLVKALQQYLSGNIADNESLSSTFAAIERSIHCLNTGAARLRTVDLEGLVRGHVTHALVQMYGKLVDCMATVSTEDAVFGDMENHNRTSEPHGKANSKNAGMRARAALEVLTKLLCMMISKLDVRDAEQASLFEGYAYTALRKIGQRLYLVVFGRMRGDSLENEIMANAPSNEEPVLEERAALHASSNEREAAKLEASYHVTLLHCVISAYALYTANTQGPRLSNAQNTGKNTCKTDLAAFERDRLQRTLVDCIFGSDDPSNSDGLRDCLKMPINDGPPLPIPKVKEAEIEEWYKEELWRMLGWDILSKEGEW